MKTKTLIIADIVFIFIMFNLLFVNIKNTFIINKYKEGKYLENDAKLLTNITFQKSYVSNYNFGNILYQNGEYEKAISEYKKALKTVISSEKEFKIRINCALAICKTVQVDESNQESINNAINTYQEAIDVLVEKNCYKHNEDARKLKEDIEKEIERLKKLQKNTDNKNNENEEENKIDENKNEENVEEKIKDIKEEATKEQSKTENIYKNFNKEYNGREKNW